MRRFSWCVAFFLNVIICHITVPDTHWFLRMVSSHKVPLLTSFSEEFAIYMNYVRKLGFEETPDYDFLRELFTKVLKTLGEPEDGIFDWMLLNNGKGWEAGNTPATLLAQAHANAGSPQTPHRERRERDHRRTSRQVPDSATPSTPHVLSPSPAHVKSNGRRAAAARGDISVQALAPSPNRRLSQQARDTGGLSAPHPYAAAPSPTGYRAGAPPGAYGRHSPLLNGSNVNNNGSESFLYGAQPKNAGNSRDGLPGTPREVNASGGRGGMAVYDRDQMRRVGEVDEDGHGRKVGFWSVLCCRA
jgi:casein kinase 1